MPTASGNDSVKVASCAHRTNRTLSALIVLSIGMCIAPGRVESQEKSKATAEVPPNHVSLEHAGAGIYFVSEKLKADYDALQEQIASLKTRLRIENRGGAERRQEIRALQEKLEALQKEIDSKKVLIVPGKVRKENALVTFKPGPEQLLFVNADSVRIEGWDRPEVRCVLEKTIVLSDDGTEEEADRQLGGLKLVHTHGTGSQFVGQSAIEREAAEQKFLDSPDGRKLDAKSLEQRRKIVRSITSDYEVLRDFQGKEFDRVEIGGLVPGSENGYVQYELKSPGGGGVMGSMPQRFCNLTISVPALKTVAIAGGRGGLDVRNLHAPLILKAGGSGNISFGARFRVSELHGSLTAINTPLDLVEAIHGDVAITSTELFVNSSNFSQGARNVFSHSEPRKVVCRNIDGDVSAWFTQSVLALEGVSGRLDVKNEFGDTTVSIDRPLVDKAHRVVSDAGRVEVELTAKTLGKLPLWALTNCGSVNTNLTRDKFDDFHYISSEGSENSVRRNWDGWKSKLDNATAPGRFSMPDFGRPVAAIEGRDRTPGLDVISRAGTVMITLKK